jgi:lysophospholipase L1-like esterase
LGLTRILCFGDSMTEGTTSPSVGLHALTPGLPQSYPFKLQELLTARYRDQTISVFNAGRAGEKATIGRDRLGGALSEARPALLILLEGANDLNALSSQGLTNVSPVVFAMEDMVREAIGRGVQVMVATLPPQRPGGRSVAAPGMVERYNNELKMMASKKGAILIDVNVLLPLSFIGQDGLHPTEGGYQKLAEIFLGAVKERYEISSAAASRAEGHGSFNATTI